MAIGAQGRNLGESVGVDSPPTVVTPLLQQSDFAATHLRWNERSEELPTRLGQEDAFLVFMQQ